MLFTYFVGIPIIFQMHRRMYFLTIVKIALFLKYNKMTVKNSLYRGSKIGLDITLN
jgi:hypothetical protein